MTATTLKKMSLKESYGAQLHGHAEGRDTLLPSGVNRGKCYYDPHYYSQYPWKYYR